PKHDARQVRVWYRWPRLAHTCLGTQALNPYWTWSPMFEDPPLREGGAAYREFWRKAAQRSRTCPVVQLLRLRQTYFAKYQDGCHLERATVGRGLVQNFAALQDIPRDSSTFCRWSDGSTPPPTAASQTCLEFAKRPVPKLRGLSDRDPVSYPAPLA